MGATRVVGTVVAAALVASSVSAQKKVAKGPDLAGLSISLDGMVAPLRHFHYDVFEIGDPGSIVPLAGLASFDSSVKGEVDQVSLPLEPNVKPIVFKRIGN